MVRNTQHKLTPSYCEEAALLRDGYGLIAGLDEVGRGPLAGPVVAGLAVLPPNPRGKWVPLVRDSKQLTPSQREETASYLREVALALEVGMCSPQEVDELGIVAATRLAMKRALDRVALTPQFLLLDALTLPDVPISQKPVIRGDELCLSIAAASIIAKVTRDQMMNELEDVHPGYGFARHKGYGTPEHLSSLRRLGPCPIHRFTFSPVRELWQGLR